MKHIKLQLIATKKKKFMYTLLVSFINNNAVRISDFLSSIMGIIIVKNSGSSSKLHAYG